MQGNYDAVAHFYDPLARLASGDSVRRAQIFLLSAIPVNSRILIIGGGTGWILEEITRLHPAGLRITYVEISEKMTAKAKKRNVGDNRIIFLQEGILDAPLDEMYDVVLTTFLLDNFSENTIKKVFSKVSLHLKENGLWLFSDFQIVNHSMGQKIALKIMYLFFNYFCKLETSTLHNTSALFEQYGYTPLCRQTFFSNFIFSVIYQKQKQSLQIKELSGQG